ncbi:MAG: hypothetical protein WCH84_05115 [Verrucomicrobiota bacterium]
MGIAGDKKVGCFNVARTDKNRNGASLTSTITWIAVVVLSLGTSVLALNVTTRARQVLQETNQIRSVVQDAVKRQEMVVKAPARREFSSAFLQMAFGDNPVLLEQVKGQLQQAISEKPALQKGEIGMMLVTYRAEGEVRDVAIQVFGDLNVERMPTFSTEGFWKGQLPEEFFQTGQTLLSLFGRDVMILANQQVRKQQMEVFDSTTNDRFSILEDYLHDPVSFIAVVPDPSKLFSAQFRKNMAAVLIKGKLSMDEARLEFVALSTDPRKAQDLAQTLADMRTMALGVARVRFGAAGIAEAAFEQVARASIRADGPAVVINTSLPGNVLQSLMPKLVRGLSKGAGRIRRGPGYPS